MAAVGDAGRCKSDVFKASETSCDLFQKQRARDMNKTFIEHERIYCGDGTHDVLMNKRWKLLYSLEMPPA